jgi:hypothetical protein
MKGDEQQGYSIAIYISTGKNYSTALEAFTFPVNLGLKQTGNL